MSIIIDNTASGHVISDQKVMKYVERIPPQTVELANGAAATAFIEGISKLM